MLCGLRVFVEGSAFLEPKRDPIFNNIMRRNLIKILQTTGCFETQIIIEMIIHQHNRHQQNHWAIVSDSVGVNLLPCWNVTVMSTNKIAQTALRVCILARITSIAGYYLLIVSWTRNEQWANQMILDAPFQELGIIIALWYSKSGLISMHPHKHFALCTWTPNS